MTAHLAKTSAAIDDPRQFALLAIDEARAETRAWKERCAAAEAQYRARVSLTETFRRLVSLQGPDIPPALKRKDSYGGWIDLNDVLSSPAAWQSCDANFFTVAP